VLATDRFWDAGVVPPCWKPKTSDVGETDKTFAADLTVSVTGTDSVFVEAVNVIVPVYVPTAKLVGVTVTVSDAGVVPDDGVRCNHEPPLAVLAAAVYARPAVVELTDKVWPPGTAPPCWKVKVREVGATLST
jgi:hypothetical protein